MIGMVYEFLPFMILPLYTSLEKIENACWRPQPTWARRRGGCSCGSRCR